MEVGEKWQKEEEGERGRKRKSTRLKDSRQTGDAEQMSKGKWMYGIQSKVLLTVEWGVGNGESKKLLQSWGCVAGFFVL